jgi:hypothetical protein
MSKMTKEELKKRKAELKKIVHAEILKREVMQFRLEPENIDKLYRLAASKRKPVGTLVREWIIDRINAELKDKVNKPVSSDTKLAVNTFDLAMDKLKSELQKPLDELNRRMYIIEDMARKAEQSRHK